MPGLVGRLAATRPDAVAVRDPTRALGWAAVDEILNRVANGLLTADLGPHRRVAVFAENAAETALAHLGGLLGGASTVPVNFHLNVEEAAYILADSMAAMVFVGPETSERGIEAARRAGVRAVVGWRTEGPGLIGWEEWLAASSPDPPPDAVRPLANFLYTSGTTGRPKGTYLPPTMFAGGVTMAEHLEALRQSRLAGYGTHLVVGPMYHTGPLTGMRLLAAGVPSVILGRFDAEATLRAIEEHRVETTIMVPTHFVRLLALPDEVRARYDVSSLRLVAHTGAACSVPIKRAMIEWWGPVLTESYGATEVGTTCAITSEEWLDHPGSVGRPVPPLTAVVLDASGEELPRGAEGRLFFRDPTGRGIEYPNDPEQTAAANPEPGLFTLGEIGYVDADGYVFITDRFSDMVVSGGVNIYPAEAEQALAKHPGVLDAACFGVPHPVMGEELIALVVAADRRRPPRSDDLIAFCREHLAHYKCPRRVEIVDDVGRTAMGKIDKRALAARHR